MEQDSPSGQNLSNNYLRLAYLAKGGTVKKSRNISQEQIDTIYRVGFSHYSSGCYDEALMIFKYLSLIDHSNHSYLLGLGATLKAVKHYQQALDVLDCAIRADKSDPRAYICRATCQIALKDFQGAAAALQAAEQKIGKTDHWKEELQQIKRLKPIARNG